MSVSRRNPRVPEQDDRPESTGRGLGRRSLLVAGSIPVAAALTMGTANAAGSPGVLSAQKRLVATPVDGSTLAELRALTSGVTAGSVYFVTDPGKEGHFRYDATDSTSVDNEGTVVVSTAGLRFKRIYQGPVSVKWFGAKGDGVTDDTVAIQKAINAAQLEAAVLRFPTSRPYLISATLVIDSSKGGLRIIGDTRRSVGSGRYSTIKVADTVSTSAPLNHVFKFTDSQENTRYEFSDLCIDGSLRARYGIYSVTINHSLFQRIWINQTLTAALAIGYGWCNDVVECELSLNKGDGIVFVGESVNALNVVNSKIYYNDGIGINMSLPTLSARIQGCTIEQNKKCGVYVQQGATALSILNCYIEANALDGMTMSGRLVKAHIVINGNSDAANPLTVANTVPCSDVVISGNIVASFYEDTFIEAYAVDRALTVQDNAINRYDFSRTTSTNPYVVLRLGTNLTGSGSRVNGCNLKDNHVAMIGTVVPSAQLSVLNLAGAHTDYHGLSISDVHRINYAPALSTFAVVQAATTPGTFTAVSTRYRMHDSMKLTGSTQTSRWGVSLNAADYPELAGKYVYFGVSVKQSAAGMGAILLGGSSGTDAQPASSSTEWREVSQVVLFPATGTVLFGIGVSSDSAAKSLLVSRPVIAELGAPYLTLQ